MTVNRQALLDLIDAYQSELGQVIGEFCVGRAEAEAAWAEAETNVAALDCQPPLPVSENSA